MLPNCNRQVRLCARPTGIPQAEQNLGKRLIQLFDP
jgi:hypothetical protein